MPKFFLCLLLTCIVINTIAQSTQFGIFGGPQLTTVKYSINGKKQPVTAKYGFQLGAGWKIPFDDNLYFAPAAFYSLKGYKVKFNQRANPPDTLAVDNNATIHTFELAFLLQYDFGAEPGRLFLKLGPSLDFQLFGKEKFNLNNNSSVNRNMTFDFNAYGRFGASMLLQLGYETKTGITLSANYTHGVGSINNADFGPRIRHTVFGITAGKYFNSNKLTSDTRNKE